MVREGSLRPVPLAGVLRECCGVDSLPHGWFLAAAGAVCPAFLGVFMDDCRMMSFALPESTLFSVLFPMIAR